MQQEERPLLPSSQLKSLGERLRRHRIHLGISQEALAEAIGASERSVRRWEQGIAIPQEGPRERLCQLFDIDPQQLFGVAHVEEAPQPTTSPLPLYMPFHRNPFFTGREAFLRHLHQILCAQNTASLVRSCALSGLGGIGKTQVAIEYVYRHLHDYSAIFWLAAETPESFSVKLF